jgi:hypothetical protein
MLRRSKSHSKITVILSKLFLDGSECHSLIPDGGRDFLFPSLSRPVLQSQPLPALFPKKRSKLGRNVMLFISTQCRGIKCLNELYFWTLSIVWCLKKIEELKIYIPNITIHTSTKFTQVNY